MLINYFIGGDMLRQAFFIIRRNTTLLIVKLNRIVSLNPSKIRKLLNGGGGT